MSKMLVPDGFTNLPDDAKSILPTTTIGAGPMEEATSSIFQASVGHPKARPNASICCSPPEKVSQPLCFFTLLQSWKDSKTPVPDHLL